MMMEIGTLTKQLKKILKKFKSKPIRGIADVAAILIVVVSLITFIAMLPTINTTINLGLGYVDSATAILLRLIPLFMVILIVLIPTN